ncbi:hypothetical protein [Roseisolibacter sp. H3M3-2]|uniref:hypothetical protein n=1 Tax=Roseisolibacter sp. H3M3-2 TaxID=3031323 RepID=UPI0023DC16F2|nr:hypothetical protein [Roseisolibacter sp. H3M3-2]MDF1501476.1 hypothetical protein [Roseisolibacter sp. H3M3-2]
MAQDRVPADENLERSGRQVTARETRETGERGHPDREVRREAVGGVADRAVDRQVDSDRYEQSETALGGADTIQKTTWGVGMGAEPDGRLEHAPVGLRKGEGTVVARTDAGGGANPIAWMVGLLAAAAALIYGFGVLSG